MSGEQAAALSIDPGLTETTTLQVMGGTGMQHSVFGDAPIVIKASETDEGRRFDATIECQPFKGARLIQFLNKVRHNSTKFNVSVDGVIDDWDLPDHADSDYSRGLLELHANLEEAWDEFMLSRPAFLDAIMYAKKVKGFGRVANAPLRTTEADQFTRYHSLFDGSVPISDFDHLIATLGDIGLDEPEQTMLRSISSQINPQRHPNRQIKSREKLAQVFNSWHPTKRMGFLVSVINNTPDQTVAELAQTRREENFGTLVSDSGQGYFFQYRHYPDNLQEAYDQNRSIVVRSPFKATEVIVPTTEGGKESFVLSGSIERTIPPSALLPHISWVVDKEGNKKFIFDRRRQEQRDDHVVHKDGVLGLLVVAYYSPHVTRSWPKTMSIEGREQRIGPVQIPVLALLKKAQLINTPFMGRLEAQVS